MLKSQVAFIAFAVDDLSFYAFLLNPWLSLLVLWEPHFWHHRS